VKWPFLLASLAIILAGLVLFGLSDTVISIADTASIPDNEVTSSEADNSSATATITITMYAMANDNDVL
jgi:hypothetical protein